MNSKRTISIVITALISTFALFAITPTAMGMQMTQERKVPKKEVFYAENRSFVFFDNNQPGIDVKDFVHRELAISKTLNGPVMGVKYMQIEVIGYNLVTDSDIRLVNSQIQLPGGWIYLQGVSRKSAAEEIKPGRKDSFTIIGGSGKYLGATGIERSTLLPDGKTFKVVFDFTTS